MKSLVKMPPGYPQLLRDLKEKIRSAQVKAALSVNHELIKLYWEIGEMIVDKQKNEKWGAGFIGKLAQDLQNNFPGTEGFSKSNVFRIKAFYLGYEKVAQAVRLIDELPIFRIPWGQNMILMAKVKDVKQRLWYAQQTIENGWSRNTLEMWIDSDLFSRQGKALTNFKATLPEPDSDLAEQSMKDPFCFDFLELTKKAKEVDIEDGLVAHVQKFLTELGVGFAFVGRQYPIEVEEETFYLDLLFYHLKLRRFVVVELKNGPFKPEHAGKMSFYLGAVDAVLKHPTDEPSIGMILCQSKKKLMVEYALQDTRRPIGVASFETKLIESLPKELKSSFPTIEEIEAELGDKSQK